MTFETLTKYTEESIKSAKEFQRFLLLKSQLELEHANKMMKLCQSTALIFKASPSLSGSASSVTGRGLKFGSGGDHTKNPHERNQILSTSLWCTFSSAIQNIHENAQQLKKAAVDVDGSVTNPLALYIKEVETVRKSLVEEGLKQTNALQDEYTSLKKAKQSHNDALTAFNEIKESHQKASRTSSTKEKDMEKLVQKLQSATEKLQSAESTFKSCEEATKQAQNIYWKETLPSILKKLYDKEDEQCMWVLESMKNWCNIDRTLHENALKIKDTITNEVDKVDLTNDMEDLYTDHVIANNGLDEQSTSNGVRNRDNSSSNDVSVRSLLNPLKAGRLQKKADGSESSWKARYFVLMGDRSDPADINYQPDSGRLYYFDSEDALKSKGIIELASSMVLPVHDSLFPGHQNVLVISYTQSDTGQHESEEHRHFYLQAESPEDRDSWINILRRYTLCCNLCTANTLAEPVSLYLDNSETVVIDLPKATARELGYRNVRNVRIWIMEGRDLASSETPAMAQSSAHDLPTSGEMLLNLVQKHTSGSFCVVSVRNNTRIAKTTVKASSAPFWGEDFILDLLPDCIDDICISVQSSVSKKRDSAVGQVVLNLKMLLGQDSLSSLNSGVKKWEGWIPLAQSIPSSLSSPLLHEGNGGLQFEKKPTGGSTPSIRVSIQYVNEAIMPLHEYPSLINCLFANEYRVLKSIAKSAERCTGFARDDFARSLVIVLLSTKTDRSAIKALLSLDLESIEDPNIVFRGNSLATKTVDQYMKIVGGEFLKSILSGPIKLVFDRASKQETCEVDPTRIENATEEILKKHQKRLQNFVQLFWNAIQNNLNKTPVQLRMAMEAIRDCVANRFPKTQYGTQAQYSAVSGFIFLRFFCPAILSPKLFGLWPDITDNPIASRTLTLIAKTLQNLANLTDFKSKEPFMEFMNNWILWNLDAMKTCINRFSKTATVEEPSSAESSQILTKIQDIRKSETDLSRELNYLYVQLRINMNELKAFHESLIQRESSEQSGFSSSLNTGTGLYSNNKKLSRKFNALPDLFDLIEKMESMYTEYQKVWDTNRNSLKHIDSLCQKLRISSFHDKCISKYQPQSISKASTQILSRPLTLSEEEPSVAIKQKKVNSKLEITSISIPDSDKEDIYETPESPSILAKSISQEWGLDIYNTIMYSKHASISSFKGFGESDRSATSPISSFKGFGESVGSATSPLVTSITGYDDDDDDDNNQGSQGFTDNINIRTRTVKSRIDDLQLPELPQARISGIFDDMQKVLNERLKSNSFVSSGDSNKSMKSIVITKSATVSDNALNKK